MPGAAAHQSGRERTVRAGQPFAHPEAFCADRRVAPNDGIDLGRSRLGTGRARQPEFRIRAPVPSTGTELAGSTPLWPAGLAAVGASLEEAARAVDELVSLLESKRPDLAATQVPGKEILTRFYRLHHSGTSTSARSMAPPASGTDHQSRVRMLCARITSVVASPAANVQAGE